MDYTSYLENKNFTESSIKSHNYTVNNFETWLTKQNLPLSQITYNDITTYINYLKSKGNKQRTIQITIGKLKHYINYQKLQGNVSNISITQLKIQGVKRQSLYDILKAEELEYIYQSYPSEEINLQQQPLTTIQKRNRVILSLLIYQGITSTDLGNLRLEHIKLYEGKIDIPETKKSNPRTLKLEPFQILLFQDYTLTAREQILKEANKETDQFIVSTGKSDKILNLLQTLMNQIKKDIPKVKNVKQIRASVITNWLKQYNLRETQYRAGHKFVSSTESYKINDVESLQKDILQFSPSI